MSNKITEWSYTKPTSPGDYLVCNGDVETAKTVLFARLHFGDDGLLYSEGALDPISEWSDSYKFAKLDYEGVS